MKLAFLDVNLRFFYIEGWNDHRLADLANMKEIFDFHIVNRWTKGDHKSYFFTPSQSEEREKYLHSSKPLSGFSTIPGPISCRTVQFSILFSFLFLLAFLPLSSQTVFYVDSSATGLNNGTSWSNAYTDLQDAFQIAGSNDSIWVAEGTYFPDGANPGDRSLSFILEDSLKVFGGFPSGGSVFALRDPIANITRLSGDIGPGGLDSYHVVSGSAVSGACLLDGLMITGGSGNWWIEQ